MPPFFAAIGAIVVGASALSLYKALRRHVNEQLDAMRAEAEPEPIPVRTLKRDPVTGEYRPG